MNDNTKTVSELLALPAYTHLDSAAGFSVGDKVLVKSDSNLGDFVDTIRSLFVQEVICQPYGENRKFLAATLTEHSWAKLSSCTKVPA